MRSTALHRMTTWTVLLLAGGFAAAEPRTGIWIEAETPAFRNYDEFTDSNMGKPELLSGGLWLMKGASGDEVKQGVPDEGVTLKYRVPVKRPGEYALWTHIGWFRARADMRWRIDDGPWQAAPATMPTTNLMEVGFFCEVSWTRLGTVKLEKGAATLEVNFPKDASKKPRMLMALDCFAFMPGHFTPEGPFRPGQTYDGSKDKAAAKQVYKLPAAEGAARRRVELSGLWQVARYDDPNMDADTYKPVDRLPERGDYELRWMGVDVPLNPWTVEPLVFGHRLIYRTKVDVPADHKGRGFKLHFSGTNWIVSVFVNGERAGTHEGVWVPWDLDISRHVRPGEVNEIAVAVKGTYYALDADAMGGKGRIAHHRNRPLDRKRWTRWVAPIYPSAKGDGDGYQYGIVNPVTFVSVGPAYTEDVFIRPSVEKKRLETDVTVRNPGGAERKLSVLCEAVDDGGKVARAFGPADVTVPAGGGETVTVAGGWEDPKLWWPEPDPAMYTLRTTVRDGDETVDIQNEPFGFREVTVRGTGIYINGVRRNFWNWVDIKPRFIEEAEDWAKQLRDEGSRFMRFSHGRKLRQKLPTREQRLDYYDRHGIPGRLCTMIDGMFISYHLGERTNEKGEDGKPILVPNDRLWESFRLHMAQVAKAYRNHPSVIFYQAENELVYINGMNIYGAYLDKVEELMNEVCDAGKEFDGTRPYTVGGGGDLSGRLAINDPHYPNAALDYYPENAYTVEHYSEKIQRWPWTRKKPWVVGESLFANELRLGAYAMGDEVFRGTWYAKEGKARFLRAVYGGYRWAGVAGFFPWDNLSDHEPTRKVFSDLYVVPRKQSWRLFDGRENELLVKVMNDTLSAEPVTFEWAYEAGGKAVASEKVAMKIEPGFGAEHTLAIRAPKTPERLEGTLRVKLSQPGGASYEDAMDVPVLPTGGKVPVAATVYVLDRKGAVTAHLKARGVPFEPVDDLAALKGRKGVLVIGHDTLTPSEAFGTELLGFAVRGGRVICLEQAHPPAGAALPAPIKPTTRFAGYAHPQALGTPLLADLGKRDLIDWAGDAPTCRNVYRKPSRGGRSLAECGGALEFSPLIEVPCGEGLILLCQLRVAEKLGVDPAADVLLRNMLAVCGTYSPAAGVAALVAAKDDPLADRLAESGVLFERAGSVAAALDSGKYAAAVIAADAGHLEALLAARKQALAFQDAGGWIVLCGVGPEGIDEFNRIVGDDFMLRPFRYEAVAMENPTYPLAATLGNRDVSLRSSRPLMHGRYWVSGNTFSHVIDGRNFAPFALPPGAPNDPFVYEPTFDDHDPYNFVNNVTNEASWRYIRQIWIGEDNVAPAQTFRLRRPDTLKTVKLWNNENYWAMTEFQLILDGAKDKAVTVKVAPSDPTVVELPEPAKVRETITIQPTRWVIVNRSRPDTRLIGIDNVQFLRPAAPEGAVFVDSVGGLVAFPRGAGGLLLNQIKFMADEPRKSNTDQKVRILGVVLQNMGVGFKSASAVGVPGVNVRFETVNLQEYGTAYLDDRGGKPGWFGRKGQDLQALPRGKHEFADVLYHVVDYATAPTPDCLMVAAERGRLHVTPRPPRKIAGIKVGHKADLLYFLHSAEVHRPVTDRERERMRARKRPFELPTVAKYVLHYADGKTAEVPVVLERHIDHWLKADPEPLPGARIGWTTKLEVPKGKETGTMRAALYSMQVNNPRPDVEITSLEMVIGPDGQRATPALIAFSTGTIIEAD